MATAPASSRPRILAVIPHYWHPSREPYGSAAARPDSRVAALDACLQGLRASLGHQQGFFDFRRREVLAANGRLVADLEILLLVHGDRHVLSHLRTPADHYTVQAVAGNPRELGFAAQDFFRLARDHFDWFFYLEDDLILQDPWYLSKLAWFNRLAGPGALLQPHRFEQTEGQALLPKVYIDGALAEAEVQPFRRTDGPEQLQGLFLDQLLKFERTANPHSGCYCLSRAQLDQWLAQPHYASRDSSFVGPLESAASLGILRTFHVYKTVPEQAGFLEVRHWGERFLRKMRPPRSDSAVGAAPMVF